MLAALGAASCLGQTGSIDGPTLGLLPDSRTGVIRWIAGVPGAATLGNELKNSAIVLAAAHRDYVLGIGVDGVAQVIAPSGAESLPEASRNATHVVLSPRGSSAVLFFAGSKTAEVFTGLPENPRMARRFSMKTVPTVLGVSDGAEAVLAISSHGREGDMVSLYTATGSQALYRSHRISAAVFLPNATKSVIAGDDGVHLVSPDLGTEEVSRQANVVALGVSADARKIVVAMSSGRVAVHDLRSGVTSFANCPCSPATMSPLRGNAVFRLTDTSAGTIWLLDADGLEPSVHFVSAGGAR